VNNDVIARDTTSVSITSPDVQRQNVEGTVEMKMSVEAPEAISNMTITAQDSSEKVVELYSGASVNTYKMDTTLLSNGLHNIIVSTTTVGGLYDQSSIKLVVYNKSVADQGELVYQWNAQEISKMVSAPTMLSTSTYDTVKDSTRITENYKVEGSDVYLGAASTGNITIDFTRHPKIIIDVNEVGNSWLLVGQFPDAVYNKIEDKPTGIWSNDQSERFNSDSNDTGHITIDLQEFVENNNTKIDFSKPITMPIFLMIANSDGCYVDVSSMKLVYDDDPDAEQVVKTFSPSEMETYKGGLYNGLNADDGGLAMATALSDSWVKLEYKNATDASWGATLQTSDVIVDFDRNPVVRFNVQNVTGSWCMKYRLADEKSWDADDKWGEYLIRDTAQTGRFEINIKDIMKDKTPTGKVSIHLIPFVLGDNGSSFELKDLQIVYPAVAEETPVEVGAEYKLTLDKSLVVAKVGQKIQLSAKTAIASDLVWTVSDTSKSYVKVNQSGLVTATGVGFATVKVATADGKAEVLCRIAVYPAATKK
jgi:hypothetical protein